MLLLIMEACPPPTLGLRPRRGLETKHMVRNRLPLFLFVPQTHCAMFALLALPPRTVPDGVQVE